MADQENPFGKPGADDGSITIMGLDEVDENPFYTPPGKYTAKCTGVDEGTSHAGNPKLTFTFTIQKPVSGVGGGAKEGIGKAIQVHCAMTPKAKWKLVQVLKGLGVETKVKKLVIKPKEITGTNCVIVVEDSEYTRDDGETVKTSNVKTVLPTEKKGK